MAKRKKQKYSPIQKMRQTEQNGRRYYELPNPLPILSPEVDIVTPVYGQPEFLKRMLGSLVSHDAGIPWTMYLVDDLGPERERVDAVYDLFRRDPRIRVLKNAKNSGFAASNNRGFKTGRSPLLLMLNSDVLIRHDNWLANMAKEFVDDIWMGSVGARLLFFDEHLEGYEDSPIRPPGKIQHAGVAFNLIGQPYHIFIGWSKDHPKIIQRREMNAVTGACLMTRRDLYYQIGGLDESYTIGNFEDVQYCLTNRLLGRRVVYQPEACLYHYSGGSGNSMTARFNEQLFQIKCKDLTEYDEWRYL